MNKKLHYILLGSILIIEATLIILFFLNIFSNTISRLNCYVDTGICNSVPYTSYYSAFTYNVENFLYLIIITIVVFGISTTTLLSSIFSKIASIILFHIYFRL